MMSKDNFKNRRPSHVSSDFRSIWPGISYMKSDERTIGTRYCRECHKETNSIIIPTLPKPLDETQFCGCCFYIRYKMKPFYESAREDLGVDILLEDGSIVFSNSGTVDSRPAKLWHRSCSGAEMELYHVEEIAPNLTRTLWDCPNCSHEKALTHLGHIPTSLLKMISSHVVGSVTMSQREQAVNEETYRKYLRNNLIGLFRFKVAAALFCILQLDIWKDLSPNLEKLSCCKARFRFGEVSGDSFDSEAIHIMIEPKTPLQFVNKIESRLAEVFGHLFIKVAEGLDSLNEGESLCKTGRIYVVSGTSSEIGRYISERCK